MTRSLVLAVAIVASTPVWAADGKALIDRYCVSNRNQTKGDMT